MFHSLTYSLTYLPTLPHPICCMQQRAFCSEQRSGVALGVGLVWIMWIMWMKVDLGLRDGIGDEESEREREASFRVKSGGIDNNDKQRRKE